VKKKAAAKRAAKRVAGARRLEIFWTERALSDLEAIADYISRDNPSAAARWVARLIEVAEKAASIPLAGRRVPEVGRDDIRERLLRNYRIVYRVTAERLVVLTVFEGHRLLQLDT
jgi:toxin ParE1/3/4